MQSARRCPCPARTSVLPCKVPEWRRRNTPYLCGCQSMPSFKGTICHCYTILPPLRRSRERRSNLECKPPKGPPAEAARCARSSPGLRMWARCGRRPRLQRNPLARPKKVAHAADESGPTNAFANLPRPTSGRERRCWSLAAKRARRRRRSTGATSTSSSWPRNGNYSFAWRGVGRKKNHVFTLSNLRIPLLLGGRRWNLCVGVPRILVFLPARTLARPSSTTSTTTATNLCSPPSTSARAPTACVCWRPPRRLQARALCVRPLLGPPVEFQVCVDTS